MLSQKKKKKMTTAMLPSASRQVYKGICNCYCCCCCCFCGCCCGCCCCCALHFNASLCAISVRDATENLLCQLLRLMRLLLPLPLPPFPFHVVFFFPHQLTIHSSFFVIAIATKSWLTYSDNGCFVLMPKTPWLQLIVALNDLANCGASLGLNHSQ